MSEHLIYNNHCHGPLFKEKHNVNLWGGKCCSLLSYLELTSLAYIPFSGTLLQLSAHGDCIITTLITTKITVNWTKNHLVVELSPHLLDSMICVINLLCCNSTINIAINCHNTWPESESIIGMDGYPAPASGSGRFSTNRWNLPPVGLYVARRVGFSRITVPCFALSPMSLRN